MRRCSARTGFQMHFGNYGFYDEVLAVYCIGRKFCTYRTVFASETRELSGARVWHWFWPTETNTLAVPEYNSVLILLLTEKDMSFANPFWFILYFQINPTKNGPRTQAPPRIAYWIAYTTHLTWCDPGCWYFFWRLFRHNSAKNDP